MAKTKKNCVPKTFAHPLFTVGHLRVLWITANQHKQQIGQWADMRHYQTAAEYEAKLDAVVSLMENITVFNVGGGLNGFGANPEIELPNDLIGRLESFASLFKD